MRALNLLAVVGFLCVVALAPSSAFACDRCGHRSHVASVSVTYGTVGVRCSDCGLVHGIGRCAKRIVGGTVRFVGGAVVDAASTSVEVVGGVATEAGALLTRTGRRARRSLEPACDCRN